MPDEAQKTSGISGTSRIILQKMDGLEAGARRQTEKIDKLFAKVAEVNVGMAGLIAADQDRARMSNKLEALEVGLHRLELREAAASATSATKWGALAHGVATALALVGVLVALAKVSWGG